MNDCQVSRQDLQNKLTACQQKSDASVLRISQLEVENKGIPLINSQLSDAQLTIVTLRKQNESLYGLQSQINDFVKQIREKQNVEIENAQLKRDLINAKDTCAGEIKRLSDALEASRISANNCNENSKLLQTQLIQVRSQNQDNQAL